MVVTSIQDGFPEWIKRKFVYHELLVLVICIISFFFGLPNIIQVGLSNLTYNMNWKGGKNYLRGLSLVSIPFPILADRAKWS